MLHQRRTTLTALSNLARMLLDWAVASDPGLIRLMLALRGTLSVLLTTVASLLLAHAAAWPMPEFASGVTLSMMAPFLMREPTARQRQITLLALTMPAAAATIATAFLHQSGIIGDACFLLLVFVCFLLHPLSPRVIGLGLVAVVTTYVGLYLELPPATLPVQLLSLLLALPFVAFSCFVAVPMNPAATVRRIVGAVQGRAAQVLRSTRTAARRGLSPGTLWPVLRYDLARLNETALAADDQLALIEPGGGAALRNGLMDVELATASLIKTLGEESTGPRSATRLLLHERRMRRGGRYAMNPAVPKPGTLQAGLLELGHAVYALGEAARNVEPLEGAPTVATALPGPLAWRLATRVTLAAGLAMAGGITLSPQRWFWAVMTVYVVFLNARSRGDTIYKGIQRLGGTFLGMASGLLLADVLAGDAWLQAAALLLSIFGMFYLFLISYTAGIFCVTVMLGLLYAMLGAAPEQLLLLRLEETAIGAAAAVFVAAFVFPARTRDQVMRSGRNVLASLAEAVGASRCALAGLPGPSPLEAMWRVDRQVADLRLALAPLTAGRLLLRRSALERPVPALFDCVHWTRLLAAASQGRPLPDCSGPLLLQAAETEARLAALADTAVAAIAPKEPGQASYGSAAASFAELAEILNNLTASVAVLSERLEIGVLEGFSMDA